MKQGGSDLGQSPGTVGGGVVSLTCGGSSRTGVEGACVGSGNGCPGGDGHPIEAGVVVVLAWPPQTHICVSQSCKQPLSADVCKLCAPSSNSQAPVPPTAHMWRGVLPPFERSRTRRNSRA